MFDTRGKTHIAVILAEDRVGYYAEIKENFRILPTGGRPGSGSKGATECRVVDQVKQ